MIETEPTDDETTLLVFVKENKLRVKFIFEEIPVRKTMKFDEILSQIKNYFKLGEKTIEKTKSSKTIGLRVWIIVNDFNFVENMKETLKKNLRSYVSGSYGRLVDYENKEIGEISIDNNCMLLCEVKANCEFFLFNENVPCKFLCDKCMFIIEENEKTIKYKISDCKTKVFCSDICLKTYLTRSETEQRNRSKNNTIKKGDRSKNNFENIENGDSPIFFYEKQIPHISEISGGLINIRNTCYLNAAFQCLKHVEKLTTYLLQTEAKEKLKSGLKINIHRSEIETSREFVSLIEKLHKKEGVTEEEIKSFLNLFTKINSDTKKFEDQSIHHDAQEFLALFLDILHVSLKSNQNQELNDFNKESNENSKISELFQGKIKDEIKCGEENCKYISTKFQNFNMLDLPIPKNVKSIYLMKADGDIVKISYSYEGESEKEFLEKYLLNYFPNLKKLNFPNFTKRNDYSDNIYLVIESDSIIDDLEDKNEQIFDEMVLAFRKAFLPKKFTFEIICQDISLFFSLFFNPEDNFATFFSKIKELLLKFIEMDEQKIDTLRKQFPWNSFSDLDPLSIVVHIDSSYLEKKLKSFPETSIINIFDCFDLMTQPEDIDCPQCGRPNSCKKTLEIFETGPIFIVYFKRMDSSGNQPQKINTFIDFNVEEVLNMQKYVNLRKNESFYDLFAICNHFGSLNAGHYTAFCKEEDQKWLFFNDHQVSQINEIRSLVTPNAYILFYKRRDNFLN